MSDGKTGKVKNMKQKLLMIYHEDGILDLVAGITILLLSSVFAFSEGVFIGIIGLPLIFYIPIKEQVSVPRIGFIRFESEAVSKNKMIYFLLVGCMAFLGLFLLMVFRGSISGDLTQMINRNEVFIFAGILGATLWGVAIFMKNSRFVYYAILGAIFVCAAQLLGIRIWIALALLGIIVETVAVYFLVRFLKQYPVSQEQ